MFPIEIPPLRERTSDIPHIIEVIVKKLSKSHLKEIHDIHLDVVEAFKTYSWPGNIRELENLMERAYILETSLVLTAEGFPNELFTHKTLQLQPCPDISITLAGARRKGLELFERLYLEELLSQNRGKIKDIGFISTRIAGTDGVSLETEKWAEVLEDLGHTCFYFAGEFDRPQE